MAQKITQVALLVNDYDEAIKFYTQKLNFELVEDTVLSAIKRWVVIAPPGSVGCRILLAKANGEKELASVGNQTGGRVFLFLQTDSLIDDHDNLIKNEVKVVRGPLKEKYGTVLVFEDLYGNLWDLIEPLK